MDNNEYNELLTWSKQRGLELHPAVERRCVDGIWGMYATQPIEKHQVLASYPISSQFSVNSAITYPEKSSEKFKLQVSSAHELAKGADSEWYPMMHAIDPPSELEQRSVFFLSDSEIEFLKKLNPLLAFKVEQSRLNSRNLISAICSTDDSVDEASAISTALNWNSRAWGNRGFLPVLDLFNNSNEHGAPLCVGKSHIFHMTAKAYEADEQLWISYDRKDLYDFAIAYDFFDPSDTHFIVLNSRGTQIAGTEVSQKAIMRVANAFRIKTEQTPQGLKYQVGDSSIMFLEHAPTAQMIQFIVTTAARTEAEYSQGASSQQSFDIRLNQILDGLLSFNNVDSIDLGEVPEKLHRFYHLLKKEKQILNNNKRWAKLNSPDKRFIPQNVVNAIAFN